MTTTAAAGDAGNSGSGAAGVRPLFLGVDVGGTFTDLVLYDASGEMRCVKVPTVPDRPGESTLAGIDELRAALGEGGAGPGFEQLVQTHSSTIATNALIERRGPRLGLVTTRGFRDLMELQRLNLPHPLRLDSRRPEPLVRRRDVHEVSERMRADGTVIEPVSEQDVVAAARRLEADGVRDVVVCFLHSYHNPSNELAAAEILRRELDGVLVDTSSSLWAQAREYERATLACINALVRPAIEGYLGELEDGLARRAIRSRLNVARSNGGSEATHSLRLRPANALLSGPAAGVAGASVVAGEAGWRGADLLTLDVGGTSADIGVIRGGSVVLSSEERVGDFPILLPTVAVSSIGAGGGSVVWFDDHGSLRVGPRSVGSFPGPACYGRSASLGEPALTDAFVAVGLLGDGQSLGGKIPVDGTRAAAALAALGRERGWPVEEVASGAIEIAVAKMVAEATRVLARRGIDAPQFRLVAFGGAGPLVAALVAEEIGVREILVPHKPGALSALGAAHADIEGDQLVALYRKSSDLAPSDLRAAARRLEDEVSGWVEDQRRAARITEVTARLGCDMRYDGQGFDVEVPLGEDVLRRGDVASVVASFHAAHRAAYGHADEGAEVWCKELRAHVVGVTEKPVLEGYLEQDLPGLASSRRLVLRQASGEVPVLARAALVPGTVLEGPLVVEQLDTTTYVPPGWRLTCHESRHLLLEQAG
ncbi:MAG TPA: hydantoinase/oxoprolinase family protein [Acidimicrobiales bacterium]|nr:hydantoinase/oxoprolinase family protein [Acidimicrobiales bacterium]